MQPVPNTSRRSRQQGSALLPTNRTPPRAVRSKVAIVDRGGLVLAVVGTIGEARAILSMAGAP